MESGMSLLSKECSRCLSIKPINDFYVHIAQKSGFTSQCKTCVKFANSKKILCDCGKNVRKNNLKIHTARPVHLRRLNIINQTKISEQS